MKLQLDLHPIFNRNQAIETALETLIQEAIEKKAPMIEIITGKGTGQMKKRVLKFLERRKKTMPEHRLYKDRDNFGRIFVKFSWKK